MKIVALSIMSLLICMPSPATAEVDWNVIPPSRIRLFYPGTASWEYLVGPGHASGAASVIKSEKNCRECHVKEEQITIRSEQIMRGRLRIRNTDKPFEPLPPTGISAFRDIEVQAAIDAEDILLRLKWLSADGAGFHDPLLDAKGLSDRIAIQLNSGLKSFRNAGCFISCHNDQSQMPESPSDDIVAMSPYYSGIKRKDIRMYAYFTRTRGWSSIKTEREISRYMKSGGLTDLWVAGFKGPEIITSDESVLTDRLKDKQQDISAQGAWQDGIYTLVVRRKMNTGDDMDIQFREKMKVNLGVALYDNRSGGRRHLVSLPLTLSVDGGEADIKAVKVIENTNYFH